MDDIQIVAFCMTLKENYTFDPCFPLDNLCYVFQIYHDCSHYACRKQESIFIHNCQNKSFVTTQLLQYVKSVLSSFYEQYWTFFSIFIFIHIPKPALGVVILFQFYFQFYNPGSIQGEQSVCCDLWSSPTLSQKSST